MPEEALQAAFEIKTACDEISRRLLRWHWEHKPGSNSLGALLDHIAQRQQESPDYYDRMPDLSGKSSWQQLDTTICMRVLLDPEKDAEMPLDLLGNTSSPGAARRACNNAGTAFRENELARYYRQAEEFLSRCGAKEPVASSRAPAEEKPAARSTSRQSTRQNQRGSAQSRKTGSSRSAGKRTAAHGNSGRSSSAKGRGNTNCKKKRKNSGNQTVMIVLLAALVLGLLVRAWSMGAV